MPPPYKTITGKEGVQILNELLGNAADEVIPPANVFDADYQPENYELLDIFIDDEIQGNSILGCVFPAEEGKIDRRSLILSTDQLVKLTQKQETEHIIFENGSAIVEMDMANLLAAI